MAKLRSGEPLKILAWGDSVTEGYLGEDQWQAQFVRRLKARFPQANVTLVTVGWGAHNSLKDFRRLGMEWIILTPHYSTFMGVSRERDLDDDPRVCVNALRGFATANGVALLTPCVFARRTRCPVSNARQRGKCPLSSVQRQRTLPASCGGA